MLQIPAVKGPQAGTDLGAMAGEVESGERPELDIYCVGICFLLSPEGSSPTSQGLSEATVMEVPGGHP